VKKIISKNSNMVPLNFVNIVSESNGPSDSRGLVAFFSSVEDLQELAGWYAGIGVVHDGRLPRGHPRFEVLPHVEKLGEGYLCL
jgi:hypothetical protein